MSEFFTRFLLPAGLAGSLGTLLLLLAKPLLNRLGPKPARGLLLCATFLFLLPFGLLVASAEAPVRGAGGTLPYQNPLQTTPPTAAVWRAGSTLSGALNEPVGRAPVANGVQTARKNAPAAVLGTLYLAGLLGCTVLYMGTHLRFALHLRRSCRAVDDATTLAVYDAICREYGLRKKPVLLESTALRAPLLTGVLRPKIVLAKRQGGKTELDFALRHELTHHRHADIALKMFVQAVCLLHWFNPLAHLLRRAFGENCEALCDAAVTEPLDKAQRLAYAGTLLACASNDTPPYAVSGFASPVKHLQMRMSRLLCPAKPTAALKCAGFALLCCTVLCGTLAGCAMAGGGESGTSSAGAGDAGAIASSAPSSTSESSPSSPVNSAAGSGGSGSSTAAETGGGAEADNTNSYTDTAGGAPSAGEYTSTPPPAPAEAMAWPVPGYTAVGQGLTDGHRGLDIEAERGAPIVAIDGGLVIEASYHYSYGNYIVIDQGDGIHTVYAHCETLFVEKGEVVEKDQPIAAVGDSGNSANTHLHIEIQEDYALLDPLDFLTPPAA